MTTRRARCRLAALALLASLVVATPATASPETLEVFDAVVKAVKERHVNRAELGEAWAKKVAAYRLLADQAQPGPELRKVLRTMLSELETSHTALLHPQIFETLINELQNRRSWTYGLLLELHRGRYFVRAMYEGGPAAKAGLRRGDCIVEVSGKPTAAHPELVDAGYDVTRGGPTLFSLLAGEGQALELVVQRTVEAASRETVTVRATKMNGVDALRSSIRVVEHAGKRVGTFHLWYCQKGAASVMEEAVRSFADCDALVIDLRGRGGFDYVGQRLLQVFREKPVLDGVLARPAWKKPVVFLIDERTRSAKELCAYRVRDERLGILVGRHTERACIGAGFVTLPDEWVLELPIGGSPKFNGRTLEGIGVAPDHDVDDVLPFSAGKDPIFDAGVRVAIEALAPKAEPVPAGR
ncbi:MAG: S41 family peptidase [Planctomycetota bacterium]|nr:S41 family peptidase [Planctomycetota bacterium]